MGGSLHQAYLMSSDLQASTAFYKDVVGLDAVKTSGDRAEFDTGDCSLVIEPDFDKETLAAFGLEPPGDDRGDGVVIVIEVDDVEAVAERAAAADADIHAGPMEVDWGRELLLVSDPDGYVLEVSRPLPDG